MVITELPNPLAVRRTVSFSEALYEEEIIIEGVCARQAKSLPVAMEFIQDGILPVLVDPHCAILDQWDFSALIDARLLKHRSDTRLAAAPFVLGLGPGFTCGENCHAVVETQRGHDLGRVFWTGSANPDTGQPEGDPRRVLRAPCDGHLIDHVRIGEHVETGQIIAEISGQAILAPISGVLRGLIYPGIPIKTGMKVGDIDPRDNPGYCQTVSDKALAIGGGVLEALLSRPILP